MNMLKTFGASVKRGKQQVMQKIGMADETKDEEYGKAREKVQTCKLLVKELEKQIKNLDKCMLELSTTFSGIADTYGEFGKMLEVNDIEGFNTLMRTTIGNLSQQAAIYTDTVVKTSLEITKSSFRKLEESEQAHAEVKQSRLDMDAMRHEVKALSDAMNELRAPEKLERTRHMKFQRESDLDIQSAKFAHLTRETKRSMKIATDEAASSMWSIYSILFQQTHQHFDDLAKEMTQLSTALTKAKNSDPNKAIDILSPKNELFSSPPQQRNILGDTFNDSELVLSSSTTNHPSVGKTQTPARLQEASMSEVFADTDKAAWDPNWDSEKVRSTDADEDWHEW
eukprot:TRINITY_DN3380_c0_g2_i1.p1 TRINITY_DN3380_c0_g2~~TRINITY_DN3380_c0_g2_i1.p1  ORF type:complete len:340 (+),score=98.14 TRINITY_DN3380_c0_g2_i1:714-1733(+)